jgi:hypothetical protein
MRKRNDAWRNPCETSVIAPANLHEQLMPTTTTPRPASTTVTLQHAFDFAQAQVRALIERYPADYYPMYTVGGKFGQDIKRWTHWCDGFYPGMMFVFAARPATGSGWTMPWPAARRWKTGSTTGRSRSGLSVLFDVPALARSGRAD